MGLFYYPTGFYDSSTVTPPDGAVEISFDERAKMHSALIKGFSYTIDAGVIVKHEPAQITHAQLAEGEREWRDYAITSTEWFVSRHRDEVELGELYEATTLTAAKCNELMQYRKALRDWPASPDFPNIESRPKAPTWLNAIVKP